MNHITTLTFTLDGRFHCDGLAPVLRAHGKSGLKPVRIGGSQETGTIGCESCPRFIKCGMSHTAEIKTDVKDPSAIIAACKEMGLPVPEKRENVHFGGTTQSGLCVQLPGWRHPLVIDTATGAMKYDNYGGRWGEQKELQKFTQMYGVSKATLIARSKGYTVARSTLPNGTIRLNVTGV